MIHTQLDINHLMEICDPCWQMSQNEQNFKNVGIRQKKIKMESAVNFEKNLFFLHGCVDRLIVINSYSSKVYLNKVMTVS